MATLQDLLRLAGDWPDGTCGSEVRRAVCELIEANSDRDRTASHRRLTVCVQRAIRRHRRTQANDDDPGLATLTTWTDALAQERAHAARRATGTMTPTDLTPATARWTPRTNDALIADLRELVDALDRRMPQVERKGEHAIARDGQRLRREALGRIATLEGSGL
jgi:hypothetical protein